MGAYAICADALKFVHLLYVAFVAFGTLTIVIGALVRWRGVRNPWFRGIHLMLTTVVAFEALIEYECPLTTLEYNLRVWAGQYKPDFRTNFDGADIGFIGEMLQSMDFGNMDFLFYVFVGVGAAVVGALLLCPPRQVFLIVSLNTLSLAILFVVWLYAGQPKYWGLSTWPQGIIVCAWNVLPFALAAAMALQLRRRMGASMLLCAIVLFLSGRGLYLLRSARIGAGDGALASAEWALPIAELLVLGIAFALARLMAREPEVTSTPAVAAVEQAG